MTWFWVLKVDPNHALFGDWGYFIMLEMGLAKFYPYTEFEVSSFIRSKFTEGVLKFLKIDPGP